MEKNKRGNRTKGKALFYFGLLKEGSQSKKKEDG
jgi:hypothetical protein